MITGWIEATNQVFYSLYLIDVLLRSYVLRREWCYDPVEGVQFMNLFDATLVVISTFELILLPAIVSGGRINPRVVWRYGACLHSVVCMCVICALLSLCDIVCHYVHIRVKRSLVRRLPSYGPMSRAVLSSCHHYAIIISSLHMSSIMSSIMSSSC